MVSAELAAVLPVIVFVLALGLSGLRLGIDQVRCVDAARVAARAVARGDPISGAQHAARSAAPDGVISISVTAAEARVTCTGQTPTLLSTIGITERPSAQSVAALESSSRGP